MSSKDAMVRGRWAAAESEGGPDRAYIIANLGYNHGGDPALARRMVDTAADIGCDAVCLPVVEPKAAFRRDHLEAYEPGHPGQARTYGDRYAQCALSLHDVGGLIESAGGVDVILAPQDPVSLRGIARLGGAGLQIDPHLLGYRAFLEEVRDLAVPVYIVAAMTHESIIALSVDVLRPVEPILLHAVMASDLPLRATALGHMGRLARSTGCNVGYWSMESDYFGMAIARALGAQVLERTFTIEHSIARGGASPGSLGREEFRDAVQLVRALEGALCVPAPRSVLPVENEAFDSTRLGLVAARPVAKGQILDADAVAMKAPGRGLSVWLLPRVVGRRVLYDLEADEPITFGLIES